MKRRLAKLVLLVLAVSALGILVANRTIRSAARGRTYSDVHTIPRRTVGLVLGCQKYLADNRPNLFFRNRVAAAAELYREGKVDYLLLSGDNHILGYDEPTDLKNALIDEGVPAEKIYLDHAGFRTLDSARSGEGGIRAGVDHHHFAEVPRPTGHLPREPSRTRRNRLQCAGCRCV